MKMFKLLEKKKSIYVGGHRGCKSEHYRENTIDAMDFAIDHGADYLEIDLNFTSDHEVIIFHDNILDELPNGPIMTMNKSLSEMKEIYGVNTLNEVLEWAKSKDVHLLLEMKNIPLFTNRCTFELVKKIVGMINDYSMFDQIILFGADYPLLQFAKAQHSHLNIGLIVPFIPNNPVQLMKENKAILYLSYLKNLNKDIVDSLHDHGYLVSSSITNSLYYIEKAKALKVDMFETDYISNFE